MMGNSWRCPYCNHFSVVTDEIFGSSDVYIKRTSILENVEFQIAHIVCPNPDCKGLSLTAFLYPLVGPNRVHAEEPSHKWPLLPESTAKPLPDYVPKNLRENYHEACKIRDLSPKASAALSRRCLQGMIRNFWEIKDKRNLKQEIDALEEMVAPEAWKAIDAVRSVGNIGAHMEKDINLIVEVEPKEAGLLIALIEQLFEEWYIARFQREERMASITALAAEKEQARKGESNDANGDA